MRLSLAAAVAMVCDTKSVRLVAQVLHHTQRFAVFVDVKRNRVAGEEYFLQSAQTRVCRVSV